MGINKERKRDKRCSVSNYDSKVLKEAFKMTNLVANVCAKAIPI